MKTLEVYSREKLQKKKQKAMFQLVFLSPSRTSLSRMHKHTRTHIHAHARTIARKCPVLHSSSRMAAAATALRVQRATTPRSGIFRKGTLTPPLEDPKLKCTKRIQHHRSVARCAAATARRNRTVSSRFVTSYLPSTVSFFFFFFSYSNQRRVSQDNLRREIERNDDSSRFDGENSFVSFNRFDSPLQ